MPIHTTLVALEGAIQSAMNAIANEIQTEAKQSNFEKVDVLTQGAKRLTKLEGDVHAEHGRLGCCVAKTTSQHHQFSVYISQGAINNNYFVVTSAIKLGWMKANQPLKVKLPTGVEFDTIAVAPNRLKERGKIGAFYKAVKVKAGDKFDVEELNPGVWEIKKP